MRDHEPRQEVSVSPLVEYAQFLLGGGTALIDGPARFELLAPPAEHWVLFRSAGNYFYAQVHGQVFESEPPRSAAQWDVIEETRVLSPRGELQFGSLTSGYVGDVLSVPEECLLRAHCRGRDEVASRGRADFFSGVEEWLVQLWPADPTHR